jgi:hypothetical protein
MSLGTNRFRWIGCPQWKGYCFGVAPKAGSSSIRQAITQEGRDYWVVPFPEDVEHRIAIIRHPVFRFKSLWRNKCRDGGKIMLAKHLNQHPIRGLTPSELFEYIQKHDNYHWTPQSILIDGKASELVSLTGMRRWWVRDFPYSTQPYPHEHRTIDRPDDDEGWSGDLYSQIEEYYADDLELFRRAK